MFYSCCDVQLRCLSLVFFASWWTGGGLPALPKSLSYIGRFPLRVAALFIVLQSSLRYSEFLEGMNLSLSY